MTLPQLRSIRARHILYLALFALFGFDGGECDDEDSSDGSGCNKPIERDVDCPPFEIVAFFDVIYHEERDETRASVRLSGCDAYSLKRVGSEVSFAGESLTDGGVTLPGQVTGEMFYRNIAGDVFRLTNPAYHEAQFPPDMPAVVPGDQPFELAWDGTPLEAGEHVSVVVTSGSDFLGSISTDTPGATSIVLEAEDLTRLSGGTETGEFELLLSRARTFFPTLIPGGGGAFSVTYRNTPIVVQVQ